MAAEFDGKSVIVTGAANGIGRAAVLAFARKGARLLAADIDAGAGAETVAQVKAEGGTADFVHTDVSDAARVAHMVDEAIRLYGRLDAAFNNAGVDGAMAPTAEADEAGFDRSLAVNLKGIWLCMRAEIPHIVKAGGGAIVNTASVGGLIAVPQNGAYAAAKHGVIGITKTAAIEYAADKVRVNALCPGLTDTGMTGRVLEKLQMAPEAIMPPLGRMASAEEMAGVAVFLCSDAAAFITGQAIAADGGLLAQ